MEFDDADFLWSDAHPVTKLHLISSKVVFPYDGTYFHRLREAFMTVTHLQLSYNVKKAQTLIYGGLL